MIFFCLISSFRQENSPNRHSVGPCGVNVRFWLETFLPPFSTRSISSQIFFLASSIRASQEESLPCFNGAGTDRIMLHISGFPYIRALYSVCLWAPGKTLARWLIWNLSLPHICWGHWLRQGKWLSSSFIWAIKIHAVSRLFQIRAIKWG